MSLFNQAKDRLKEAVGDAAEDNVDGLRNAVVGNVQDLLEDQMEELLGKAVVATMAAVREELQNFAALHLATKEDIERLETLIMLTGRGALPAGEVRVKPRAARPASTKAHPAATGTAKARRPRVGQS
ncbi:MAG: hypothetical protein M3011_09430 [Actinomycetota bacterium]|nr:hypothetical protein [Actinomycetota bacterium]